MGSRSDLHTVLCEALGGTSVYYQPPESVKMEYPAIVYSRDNIVNEFADDSVYNTRHVYQVIVIDYDPDSEIVERVAKIPTARYSRHYTANNLNHDVFIIYF